MRMVRVLGAVVAFVGCAAMANGLLAADVDGDDEAKSWAEAEVQLPPPPKEQDLIGFYVSPATENRFFVDSASISVGSDGVVRYTLVVLSAAGARNVSFEGMRCETRERRLYAFGRPDGSWSKSRNDRWEKVREAASNRQHASLFQEYFCPDGVIVRTADEAKDALRRGIHPSSVRW